jgi:polyhydroxybutyrate depolymerase
VPLLLVFHGSTWNGLTMEDITGFDVIADRERFIVVYPDGTGPGDILSWNAGYCCSTALEQDVDDLAFVAALLDVLTESYPIDQDRVYATGFSNGAMLTYVLAAEYPQSFAAVAPVAGAMYPGQEFPEIPVPILIMHGSSDAVVPFDGGWGALGSLSGRTVPMLAVQDTVDLWLSNNGCTQDSPSVVRERNARIETYADCNASSEVVLVILVDGRHVWPTVTANASDFLLTEDAAAFLTTPSDDSTDSVDWALFESGIEASEIIWEFFSRHARS